ncbi:MAG: 4Fe-4S dicluster domain-containing protein [Clostridia bacterium]|nr:4Fe-4S dicluster domain-containing protein [Clostridia bacterium]
MALTEKEITRVKALGFLHNRGTETFNVRVVNKNGTMTAEQLQVVADCAREYGRGYVSFTSRLQVEIPGVPLEYEQAIQQRVQSVGMVTGGTGAKVRPITACKGTTCVYGNADTQGIAARLFDTFYTGWHDVTLPHKFKISVGGCPNSCMKPSLNDIGFEGHKIPRRDLDKCRGCGKCAIEARCPMKAARVADGKISVDASVCNECGVCVNRCPFGVVGCEPETVFAVYVGGTWGKHTRMGTRLNRYYHEDELETITEKVLLWFRENAYQKERLGAAIDRVGVEAFEKAIEGDDLLNRREQILAAPIKVRG